MADRGNRYKDDPRCECRQCGGPFDPIEGNSNTHCQRCIHEMIDSRQRKATLAEDILRERHPDVYHALAESGKLDKCYQMLAKLQDSGLDF
jgi:reverse gyrase